ncbi:MAG: DUF4401 domain-containing protein [Hellea sp.]
MTAPLTVTLDDIPPVIEAGLLPNTQYLKAVSFLRDEEFWTRWAIRALLAIAVGHILSGIIFFFAFNWNDLSGMAKFSIVGGGIAACLLAWVIAKLDSPAGQAFGIGATVLVGVMFAVLGQVYQTPAMIHTPFLFWAALTLPFALASRNLAHWTVWLVILTVAVTSYANSGLRLAGDDTAANLLNIVVAGGCIAGLILLDKVLAPRLKWTRAEWFRVLLVLGATGFAFFGFTESFWGVRSALWLLAFSLIGGLLAYLYVLKPSLATLSLASFGLFALVAQFGFKMFQGGGDDVGVFFVIFIWLGALTIGLVAAFRHFIKRFKSVPAVDALDNQEDVAPFTQTISRFSQELGLEESAIAEVFASDIERDQPWYMGVFLAFAGILTALLGCAFFGSFLAMLIGDAEEFVFGILGIVIFVISIGFRRKIDSPYLKHMLNTMIIIGGILAALGFGLELKDFDAVIIICLILSLIVLMLVKDRILEFLSAGASITLIGMELYHLEVPMVESIILIISTVLGVVLLTRPIGKRLYKAAGTAFLMAPAILGIFLVHSQRWASVADASRFSDDWPARIISLIVLIGGVFFLNRGKAFADVKPPIAALLPLLIGAAFVPLGGASALLLILTGYILGSRSLAIIGSLLQIYFLTMFYYDLSLDLLTKSIVLFLSGLIFLGVWVFVRRKEGVKP